jgi:hypothetical protein
MENFDGLKDLWQKGPDNDILPTAKEIFKQIEKNRKKMLRKNIFLILILLFTFAFIFWIGLHYEFGMPGTYIGIIITLIAIVTGIVFNTRLTSLLMKQSDPTLSNNSYLQELIKYRNRQRIVHTKGITLYFILLTTGILLYMYEFAVRDFIFGLTAYSLTLAWIAFNWFYLRKKTISKQENLINKQIKALEDLSGNFEKEENIDLK